MANANTELLLPKVGVFRLIRASLWHVLLRFAPSLIDRMYRYHPTKRILEYPFVHENIAFGGGSNILDVGSGSSLLPFELVSKGYKVWSLDLKKGYHEVLAHDGLTFVQLDIRKTDFSDCFFDYVIAISSLEHVGFDGDNIDFDGDIVAIQEIWRILKPGCRFIITVPLGKRGTYSVKGKPTWRVYNLPLIQDRLSMFEIEKMNFALIEGSGWRPAMLDEVQDVDSLVQKRWCSARAVVLVVAKKA